MDTSRKALLCELKREQNNLTRVLADHLYEILEHKQAIEVFALQFFTGQKEKSLSDITGFLHGEKAFTQVVLYDLSGTPFYMSSPGKNDHAQSQKIRQIITNMVENKNTLLVELDRNTVGISWQIPFLFPLRKGGILHDYVTLFESKTLVSGTFSKKV
ncbi:MAG: hypothetical protein U9P10_13950 [Thermodesulfobacteriota bacterium]|nr:hypothetical protein [Thermodesulfobacteriota bacterium]